VVQTLVENGANKNAKNGNGLTPADVRRARTVSGGKRKSRRNQKKGKSKRGTTRKDKSKRGTTRKGKKTRRVHKK
jgi:hypothetical protein